MGKDRSGLGAARAGAAFALAAARAAAAPPAPPYLILFVTHRCNAHCPFCFNAAGPPPAGGEELCLAELERIAGAWPGLLHVTLTGGEPCLRDDLAEIALAFVRAGAKSLTLDTNGSRPDRAEATVKAILAAAPNLALDLNLSIDGPAELHDRLRGIPDGRRLALETARRLASLQERHPHFRLGATVTVSAFNQHAAPETVRELRRLGLFRRIAPILVRGRPADPKALDFDPAAYQRCLAELGPAGAASWVGRVKAALSGRVREITLAAARGGTDLPACRAGRTMVEVDAAGAVYPCELLGPTRTDQSPGRGRPWVMGQLRELDYDIRRVTATPDAAAIVDWIRETRCRCGFECAAFNNIAFNPAEWPGLLRRALFD